MRLGDTLELVNVSREYSGEYICNAENGVGGPIRESMDLNVLCKFLFLLLTGKREGGERAQNRDFAAF